MGGVPSVQQGYVAPPVPVQATRVTTMQQTSVLPKYKVTDLPAGATWNATAATTPAVAGTTWTSGTQNLNPLTSGLAPISQVGNPATGLLGQIGSGASGLGSSVFSGVGNIGRGAANIFPFFQGSEAETTAEFNEWKGNADFDQYLKFRKYCQFRDFADSTDDWAEYKKFRKLWKAEKKDDEPALRADYNRWKRNYHPAEKTLWIERCAWKALKDELNGTKNESGRRDSRQARKDWRKYKTFHSDADEKSFAQYYYSWQWKKHSDRDGRDWKDEDAYWRWLPRNRLSRRRMRDAYNKWHRQYNDDDYRHWKWYAYDDNKRYFNTWNKEATDY